MLSHGMEVIRMDERVEERRRVWREYMREWRANNRERYIKYQRQYYQNKKLGGDVNGNGDDIQRVEE